MKSETGLWEEEWEQDKKVCMCEKRHKDNEHKRSPSLVETRHEVTQASGLQTEPLFGHTDKACMTLTTNLINALLMWDGIYVSEKGWTVRDSVWLPPESTQESPLKPSDDGECVGLLWFLLIIRFFSPAIISTVSIKIEWTQEKQISHNFSTEMDNLVLCLSLSSFWFRLFNWATASWFHCTWITT